MMVLKTTRILRAAVICIICAKIARAHLNNGNFEVPALAEGQYLNLIGSQLPYWTITSGSIDVANLPVLPYVPYDAFEGAQALDLNGSENGAITQDFSTLQGFSYVLSFSYADNPYEGGISSADVRIVNAASGAALLSGSISHSTSTGSFADWQYFTNYFTATGTLSRLSIASTSTSNSPSGGIILDNIIVNTFGDPLPGDYNNNGAIDAADYVLWRKGGPLANEVDNPGTVNAADYIAWRARFGNSGGSGTAAIIPEPPARLLMFTAFATLIAITANRSPTSASNERRRVRSTVHTLRLRLLSARESREACGPLYRY
jgi:hypothetical protein